MSFVFLLLPLLLPITPAQAQDGRTHEEWQAIRTAWLRSIRGPFVPNVPPYARWPSDDLPPPPRTGPRSPVECDVLFTNDPEYPFIDVFAWSTGQFQNLDLTDFFLAGCDFPQRTDFYDVDIENGEWRMTSDNMVSLRAGFVDNVDFYISRDSARLAFGIINMANSQILSKGAPLQFSNVILNNTIIHSDDSNDNIGASDSEIFNSQIDILTAALLYLTGSGIYNSVVDGNNITSLRLLQLFIDNSIFTSDSVDFTRLRNFTVQNSIFSIELGGSGELTDAYFNNSALNGSIIGDYILTNINLVDTDITGLHIEASRLIWGDAVSGNYYCLSAPPEILVRTDDGRLAEQPIPAEPRDC